MVTGTALIRGMLKFGQTSLVIVFALSLIAALHPDAQSGLRVLLDMNPRSVLSSASADLAGDGSQFTVAKIRSGSSIFLEIYRHAEDGALMLAEKIELRDAKDGYFSFNGQASNLAIKDIDGDERLEILAPTFDRDLVGRINVYRYNDGSQGFEPLIR